MQTLKQEGSTELSTFGKRESALKMTVFSDASFGNLDDGGTWKVLTSLMAVKESKEDCVLSDVVVRWN